MDRSEDTHSTLIQSASSILGVNPLWLDALIGFESNHNPQAKNPIPYNKASVDRGEDLPRYARGLIQFTDQSAVGLGYSSSLDLVTKLPTYEAQLMGAVVPYLKRYAPFTTKQSLYLSVFYPAYRYESENKVFSDTVQAVNPGIRTVGDYVRLVDRKEGISVAAGSIAGLIVAGVAAYLIFWR